MIRSIQGAALVAALFSVPLAATAQDLLIRDARVHTAAAAGTLERADILVQGGVIRAVGPDLAAPAGIATVQAQGRPVTPGLFAGLTGLGVEEVSGEAETVDSNLSLSAPGQASDHQPTWRPEFDMLPAFNPRSAAIGVSRVAGLTWTVLAPGTVAGGSFVAGQGAAVTLDGRYDAELDGSRSLFINLGADANTLAGNSRAGQFLLLDQALREARPAPSPAMAAITPGHGLLTALGRETMMRYGRGGRVVFHVDRASDIRQALKLAERAGFKPVIAGGAEAWLVAGELARAEVPVLIDALVNLPQRFDHLAARLDNAARLHAAGVQVMFSQSGDATHNARKIRQLAGNAVANGLPWEAGLAALTRIPAQSFGVDDRLGSIEVGKQADLVLWTGDPLEVTTVAEQVWFNGRPASMQSRQTRLRDRYLQPPGPLPRAYSH
ncbi:MAG: amidohydrolase family protein [Xanthomonadales bacterium]|nr:amidohydrolase family protein [Xanthomonadales bacterium]